MAKNVLLITVDSLRYDSIPSKSTINDSILADLQSSAISFPKAFATGPGTTPSFPALLTGTLPLSYDGLGPLSKSRPRISEYIGNEGIETAAFQCNPFLSSYFNYDVGYDEFVDYQNALMGFATKLFPRGIEINNPKIRKIDKYLHFTEAIKTTYRVIKGKPRPYVSADVITNDVIEWLGETREPFFCWAHYMDVHHPCHPPKKYREHHGVTHISKTEVSELYSDLLKNPEKLSTSDIENLVNLYKAAIEYTDDQISRIISELKSNEIYKDTLIIITSDHGELFGEHDQYGKPERMYDELLHIPLFIVNGPDYLEDASDHLVSLLDVPPLIHDVLDVEVPDSYEGRIPGADEPRNYVMAEHEVAGKVIVGARSENWLYEGDEINGEHRLFDLREESLIQIPVNDNPEVHELRQAVLNRLDDLDVDVHQLEHEVEGDIESRLEDLGYL